MLSSVESAGRQCLLHFTKLHSSAIDVKFSYYLRDNNIAIMLVFGYHTCAGHRIHLCRNIYGICIWKVTRWEMISASSLLKLHYFFLFPFPLTSFAVIWGVLILAEPAKNCYNLT